MIGNAIPDIPRFYTAIAEWLSCMLFVILVGPRVKKLRLALLSGAYLLLLVAFMELTATITLYLWLPCMLLAFLSIVGFIGLTTRSSCAESFFYGAMAFSLAETMASVEWQILNHVIPDAAKNSLLTRTILLIIVYILSVFIAWRLLRHRILSEKRMTVEGRDLAISLFICTIVFGFSNLSFLTLSPSSPEQFYKEISYTRTLVDIAGVAMLYAHFLSCRNNMVRRELNAVQSTLQNQYLQYKQSREAIDVINMKHHDLKHQIHMLREMNDSEQRAAFLDRMEADIKAYELQNKTGNSVLDTLLTGRSMYCNKHGITLTVVADGSLLDFMDAMDICSIFGNALENATESVLKIKDKEKRLIHVSVSQVKSFVMIRIQNYFEGDVRMNDGDFVTTKADVSAHGYGIKSIKYTVNRYDGVVKINSENQWFDLKILIPYNS